jgi:transketolase
MRNQILAAISPLVEEHKLFILLGDLGVYQCNDIFARFPLNILNYGIMEQSMLGVSAGLSSSGMYPIVYSITPFLIDRAYEQIKLDLVYNKNPCLLISAGSSYDYSKLGEID